MVVRLKSVDLHAFEYFILQAIYSPHHKQDKKPIYRITYKEKLDIGERWRYK